MAYFEYGYVNTGYDTNSDIPQGDEEESTCNFNYSISDLIHHKINNFNYSVIPLFETKQVDFNYDVLNDFTQKIYLFNYTINNNFINSDIAFNSGIDYPIFVHKTLSAYYNIGNSTEPLVNRIVRSNEND